MKRLISLLSLIACTIVTMAQGNDWMPHENWPFIYETFQPALIHTTTTDRAVKGTANIHVGQVYMWFVNANKTIKAKAGTIRSVTFSDGARYVPLDDKLVLVLREDTVNNKIMRLLESTELDLQAFQERNFQRSQADLIGSSSSSTFMNSYVTTSENDRGEELPLKKIYYIEKDGEAFELTTAQVTKHLDSKEERVAFRNYVRTAEVIVGNKSSAINVYTTFFLK